MGNRACALEAKGCQQWPSPALARSETPLVVQLRTTMRRGRHYQLQKEDQLLCRQLTKQKQVSG